MSLRCISGVLSLLVATMLSVSALAEPRDGVRDEIARQDLALIQTQLGQVQQVVDRLEGRMAEFDPHTTRVFLDVARLRHDLDTIVEGIDEVLSPPRLPPRHPLPLAGDYLREVR